MSYNVFSPMLPQTTSRTVVLVNILGRKRNDDDVWGLVAGLFLGAVGLAILASAVNPKCPACKRPVKKGEPVCSSCGALLAWR